MVRLSGPICLGFLLLTAAAPADQGTPAHSPTVAKKHTAQSKPAPHPPKHTARKSKPQAQQGADRSAPPPVSAASRVGPGYTPAPLPNDDIRAPISPVESRTHATPALFDLSRQYRGDGYVYGSSPQAKDDSRAAHVPGVELKVPLQQK